MDKLHESCLIDLQKQPSDCETVSILSLTPYLGELEMEEEEISEIQQNKTSKHNVSEPNQTEDIRETLQNINQNMSQMASILKNMYGQSSHKRPTGRKRYCSQSPTANSSAESDTPCHRHESWRQNDTAKLSVHASEEDDLDDDVRKLTEQNKAVNDHSDLSSLRDLAVKLDDSDTTGEAVQNLV